MATCAECKQEVDETKPYFWGREGGEWHAACYARWQSKGSRTCGMWRNDNGPYGPQEYEDELARLDGGKRSWFRDENYCTEEEMVQKCLQFLHDRGHSVP